MSRQTERQNKRADAKIELAANKIEDRKTAKRALLERQTAREKSGFYAARSVAASISPSRSRLTKRKVKKGAAFGRIIRAVTKFGREISLHATKGWRSHRA